MRVLYKGVTPGQGELMGANTNVKVIRQAFPLDGSITLILSYEHVEEMEQVLNLSSYGGSSSNPITSVTSAASSRFTACLNARGCVNNPLRWLALPA